jgi:hypothetical protein
VLDCGCGVLAEEEFLSIFGMTRNDFNQLPVWRQQQKKKISRLF